MSQTESHISKAAYAIVRVDQFHSEETPLVERITVKKIVFSKQLAESEVDRLTRINRDKGCTYFVTSTRISEAE
jgi:hypothetical protein